MKLVNGYTAVFNEEAMTEKWLQKTLAVLCTLFFSAISTLNYFSVREVFALEG